MQGRVRVKPVLSYAQHIKIGTVLLESNLAGCFKGQKYVYGL